MLNSEQGAFGLGIAVGALLTGLLALVLNDQKCVKYQCVTCDDFKDTSDKVFED